MDQRYPYLDRVDQPEDFRAFTVPELKGLCADVRKFLIEIVSQTGGHLGAGLGSVELAVACHYVFNTPHDKLVWDVGHQAYPHKILTGRKDRFSTIRQYQGLSGFLRRAESSYDTFGAGHASTAISAALGMVAARELTNDSYKVVAVVGDGAMTGGMAYEGMNNAGLMKKDMIVILNDNNMSIAPNVWAISDYFTQLISNPSYNKFKSHIYHLTGKLDTLGDRIRGVVGRLEEGIKVVITPGMLFEALGFRYFGPVNGNNVAKLVQLLQDVKNYHGPILVHAITRKGKGYAPAEKDIQKLHGVTPFDKVTGIAHKKAGGPQSFTSVFGKALVEIAQKDPRVVGITAAMPDGTGLDHLQKALPGQFYDVGIAEQHGVTFAAGLATQGCRPVVSIYSTFLQRAFDQLIHDVAIQQLHVVFVLDRAGIVGADGPTHHGVFDLTYLRLIPGMTIMVPKDESELRDMLYTALYHLEGPVALRYPRGNCVGVPVKDEFDVIPHAEAEVLRKGDDVAILAIGPMVQNSLKAASDILEHHGISALVSNMRFVKPIDRTFLEGLAGRFRHVITVEDNVAIGGFGGSISEFFAGRADSPIITSLGIPDRFIGHGTQDELYRDLGLTPEGIARTVLTILQGTTLTPAKLPATLPA